MTTKEEPIDPIKTYDDNKQTRRTISVSYRCNHCGIVWQKLKDAKAHSLNCNKGNQNGK